MAERSQKVKERRVDPSPYKASNPKLDRNTRNCDPLAECRGGAHEKYEKIKELSTGAFGFVQLCRNKRSGQLVAIKFLERVRYPHTVCILLQAHRQFGCMSSPCKGPPVCCLVVIYLSCQWARPAICIGTASGIAMLLHTFRDVHKDGATIDRQYVWDMYGHSGSYDLSYLLV